MNTPLHSWDVTPQQAIEIQKALRSQVVLKHHSVDRMSTVAGADVSFDLHSDRVFASVVVMTLPSFDIIARSGVTTEARFPYIPGLLSFREGPAVLKAWEGLDRTPDALLLDGQGWAHPRRFGLACHIGVWLGLPTVGCAKTILVGSYDEPWPESGSMTPLIHRDEIVGVALRTRDCTKPMFISPGHLIDCENAVTLVQRCGKGYRVPEPVRQAHLHVNALRKLWKENPNRV